MRPLSLLLLCWLSAISAPGAQAGAVHVVVETELGPIELALAADAAPGTTANFLRYVDAGLYDGGRFHRAVRLDNQVREDVKIEVIQGGRSPDSVQAHPGFGAIALERTSLTGLKHLDGTVSMARGGGPDSAVSDFFICINDQPTLDEGGARNADGQGFGAFGRVVAGMDIVRQIQARPAPAERLESPVRILRVRRK